MTFRGFKTQLKKKVFKCWSPVFSAGLMMHRERQLRTHKGALCKNRAPIKVAFSQKGLMRLSFLQTDEPNYFPELDFFFHSK